MEHKNKMITEFKILDNVLKNNTTIIFVLAHFRDQGIYI